MSNTKILPDLPDTFYVRHEDYEMSKAIQRKLFKLGFWRRKDRGGKSTVAAFLSSNKKAYIRCYNIDSSTRWHGKIEGTSSAVPQRIIKYNDLMNMEA